MTLRLEAPSGRELPTKSGEGERVTLKLVQTYSHAGSFRHAPRATFLPEEGFLLSPIITHIGRENNSSAEICKRPYENQHKECPFCFVIFSPLYSSSRPQKTTDDLEFKYVASQNKLGWWHKLGRWLR